MPEIEIPEIREIVPPPPPPDMSWPFYFWIIIALAIIAIAVLIILLVRGKTSPLAAAAPAYDARKSALTKLHELKENYLEIPAAEFALQASHALREYLTPHYGSTTPFETGREFLERQDANHLMSEEKFILIRDLYLHAERLKYAPQPGADSERLGLVQDIIDFVRDDTPGIRLMPASQPQSSNSDSDADPLPA